MRSIRGRNSAVRWPVKRGSYRTAQPTVLTAVRIAMFCTVAQMRNGQSSESRPAARLTNADWRPSTPGDPKASVAGRVAPTAHTRTDSGQLHQRGRTPLPQASPLPLDVLTLDVEDHELLTWSHSLHLLS